MSRNRILEFDRGHAYPYQGNYTTYLDAKAEARYWRREEEAETRLRTTREARTGMGAHAPPMARQAKSKARGCARYEELASGRASRRQPSTSTTIYIPPGPRLGNLVIEARDTLSKAFGDNRTVRRSRSSRCRAAESSASSVPSEPVIRRCSTC